MSNNSKSISPTAKTVTFSTRVGLTGYTVLFGGELMGTVARNGFGVWVTTHRDGTAGPGAHSRIDAGWALVNS